MGGGGTKISWAQGRKVPKYGPAYSGNIVCTCVP